MATRLKDVRVDEISFVKRGANQGAKFLIIKSEDDMANRDDAPPTSPVARLIKGLRDAFSVTGGTPEERMAKIDPHLKEVEAALAAPVAAAAKTEDPPPPTPTDAVTKQLAESLKKAADENAELRKQVAADRERLAALEKKERDREVLAKAEVMIAGAAGVTKEELAPVIEKLDDAARAVITKVFNGLGEAQKQAQLFHQLGMPGAALTGAEWTKVQASAEQIRKADPKLTEHQALAKAIERDPAAYEAYLKSHPEQTN